MHDYSAEYEYTIYLAYYSDRIEYEENIRYSPTDRGPAELQNQSVYHFQESSP